MRFYKKVDKFVEKFEKIIDAPITITANKLKVSTGGVEFTLQSDGEDLKVDVNFGKKKIYKFRSSRKRKGLYLCRCKHHSKYGKWSLRNYKERKKRNYRTR